MMKNLFQILSLTAIVAMHGAESATIQMNVYYDKVNLCTDVGNASSYPPPQSTTVGVDYGPSCMEIYNYLGSTDLTTVGVLNSCYSTPLALGYAQNIGLFNGLGGGVPGGDLYYGATGNFSAFKILSCTESDATLQLFRVPNVISTLEQARDCFYLPGTTNDTTTTAAMRSTESFSLTFSGFSITSEAPMYASNVFNLGSASISTSSGTTWNMNKLASTVEQMVQTASGPQTQDIFDLAKNYTFVFDLNTAGMGTFVRYIAPRLEVTLSQNHVQITLKRNLSDTPIQMRMPLATCSMQYTVMQMSNGRNYGDWLPSSPDGTVTSSLARNSIGRTTTGSLTQSGYGYPLLVSTVDNGCLDKCTANIEVTTMGTGYNPAYGSSGEILRPNTINGRCYSGSFSSQGYCTTPLVVSKYAGIDCLCGDLAGLISFPKVYIPAALGAADPTTLTAKISSAPLTSVGVNNLVFNYSVSSGKVLGSSSGQPETYTGYLAGSIVGGIIAAVVFVGLFFAFSKPMGDSSKEKGAFLVEKTTTPLAGVQLVLIFLATACMFGAALSPESMTVLIQQGGAVAIDTYSVGIWLRIESDGNVGTLSGSTATFTSGNPNTGQLQYSCNFFLLSDMTQGGNTYDFSQVNSCATVRATSSIAVIAGIGAVFAAYYSRQRIVLMLVILATFTSVVVLAVFKTQLIDVWLVQAIPDYNTYVYGNGFHMQIAGVFFFLLEIMAWIIDWLSLESLA